MKTNWIITLSIISCCVFMFSCVNEDETSSIDVYKRQPYKDIPLNDFCEYILPHRVTVEPVTDWWKEYHERYRWLGDSLRHKPLEYVMDYAAIDYKDWFKFTTGKEPQRNRCV